MLFAEIPIEGWLAIIAAVGVSVTGVVTGVLTLVLQSRREDARIAREVAAEERAENREQEKLERDRLAALKVAEVKEKLELNIKQTDGMGKALNEAIAKGSVSEGRLIEMDKVTLAAVKEVAVAVNGHGEKQLDKIEHKTDEIKADTGALVNEIAADVKKVVKAIPK